MNNSSLISVIVASYNHSNYIEECLNSLLAQSYKNWELIVCDDSSTDNSVEIFDNWINTHKIVAKKNFHTVNTGFCRILNECIKLCEGEYVKIIAADDIMKPDLLEKAIITFKNHDDEYGIFYSDAEVIDGYSNPNKKYVLPDDITKPSGWVRDKLLAGNFVPALTVVMKKKVIDKIGDFNISLVAEDYDYWVRASEFFKFIYYPSSLAYYRVHGGNISINYDCEGEMRKVIMMHDKEMIQKSKLNTFFKERYYEGNLSEALKRIYYSYEGRNKFMTWCIKRKLPYKIFRFFDVLGF